MAAMPSSFCRRKQREALAGQAHRFVFAKQSSMEGGIEDQEPTQDLGRLEFKRGVTPSWGWALQPRPTGLALRKNTAAMTSADSCSSLTAFFGSFIAHPCYREAGARHGRAGRALRGDDTKQIATLVPSGGAAAVTSTTNGEQGVF